MRFWTMVVVASALSGAVRAQTHDHAMVDAANPLAVEAGLKVLRAGGSAVDAAIAVQSTLGLVEPQSSGVGGGAFMTFYDARTRTVTAYDGREIAPAAATSALFLKADGHPMAFSEAVLSGRSAGVPGAMAMLALAHHDHGKLAWRSDFVDAETLATDGFIVSPRLAGLIAGGSPQAHAPDVVAYFTNADGTRMKAGDRLRNLAYAATLRRLGAEGPSAILRGSIAADIVKRLAGQPTPGAMTLADLAAYRPHEATALCRPYRTWIVCEPNAPSGGVATLEGLGLLERTDIAKRGPERPRGLAATRRGRAPDVRRRPEVRRGPRLRGGSGQRAPRAELSRSARQADRGQRRTAARGGTPGWRETARRGSHGRARGHIPPSSSSIRPAMSFR